MKRYGYRVTCVAILASGALVAGACTSTADTAEVSAESGGYGANLQTSTTVPDGQAGSDKRSTDAADPRARAIEKTLGGLAENPELLADLENITPQQLEELTGLDSKELGTLGITPATVGALGSLLDRVRSNSPEASDEGALISLLTAGSGALLTRSGQLTGEASGLLASLNVDPATFAALIATAMTVPDDVADTLGTLLAVVDPNGLGQFRGNTSALALISVVLAAMIGRDPVSLGQLANAGNIDPRFAGVTKFIFNLATGLSPQLVDRINNITGILGPYTIQALGAAFALLERPAVGALFEEAFSDPVTVATAFGAALLSIPGLPELIAPNTFNNPMAIYGAVLGIAVVSLLNADAPGFRDFLRSIGVKVPES